MLDVTELQHAAGLGVVVGVNNKWPSIDPLDGSRRTHAQQEQRILGLRSSEPGGVHEDNGSRIYQFGQCRCGGIQHMDAVHHTFPAIGWYWVLGVHQLLPQGPVGTEGDLDG